MEEDLLAINFDGIGASEIDVHGLAGSTTAVRSPVVRAPGSHHEGGMFYVPRWSVPSRAVRALSALTEFRER